MLTLIRHTFDLVKMVSAGEGWTRQANLQQKGITRVRGMRLGIVGMGRIGTAVAQRARAFGVELSFYDPNLPAGAHPDSLFESL
jgi:phosphoglycerate dehydrogenase-like enzyme